ncbi:MAG: ClC family H(+)/Cl(-) exchange transporter [Eubacteriales bacterium]|jgi:H+/Cl- antiporter ClcA
MPHTKKAHRDSAYNVLKRAQSLRYPLIGQGIVVGVAASLVTIAYRLLIDQSGILLQTVIDHARGNLWLILGWMALLLVMAVFIDWLNRKEPMSAGSGIPQVEGELCGLFDANWKRVLPIKFISGILTLGCGLSMGREGPSVQLGAMAGKGVSDLWKRSKSEEKLLITAGAGAGLAAAFNAPLSGLLFALEELHKNLSTDVLLSTMAACVTADFISKYVFGLTPAISFSNVEMLPWNMLWVAVVMGLLTGALGAFYNFCCNLTQNLYSASTWLTSRGKLMIPFFFAGLLAFTFPQVLRDGHNLIDLLIYDRPGMGMLLLILVVKYVYSMMCFGSNAPGGTLVPLIVLGALIGGAAGTVAVEVFHVDAALYQNFMLLGMTGYFAAIIKAPITGILLTCEVTGSFRQFLPYSMVALVAYVVSDLLQAKPIYEQLLNRMIATRGENRHSNQSFTTKTLVEIPIYHGSRGEGKTIGEIPWPADCLVVSVQRDEREIIPKGGVRLYAGDTIVLLTNEERVHHLRERMARLFQLRTQ